MHWRRIALIIVVVIVVGGGLIYGFMPKPVPVEAVAAVKAAMRVTIDEEGKTRVVDRYVVAATVAGTARRIDLDVGAPVNKGQALAVIDALAPRMLDKRSMAEAASRVEAARAGYRAAKERYKAMKAVAAQSASDLKRIKGLFESGVEPKERLLLAQTDARRTGAEERSAKFSVEVARYELESAKTILKYSASFTDESKGGKVKTKATVEKTDAVTVTSPIDGRVLKVLHKSEGAVTDGMPLIEVGDTNAIEVEVDVLSADSVRITPGTRVILNRWGGAVPLEGRVRLVEPAAFTKLSALGVEEQRVNVISDIVSTPEGKDAIEGRDRLGDGYRVEASFVLWEGKDVLQVPSSAIFRYQDGWAVFSIIDKKAVRKVVKVGHRNGLVAEILSGISVGEMIVTHPGDNLEDGKDVRLR